jgi:hypothetical protein
MYYIYHIPGVKIGCSKSIESRIKSQKFSHYEILETHTDIFVASNRELKLQKQYGYPVDRIPYWMSLKRIEKAQEIGLQTRDKWGPLIDWKAREEKINQKEKWDKVKSHPNYINRDKFTNNGSWKLKKIILQYDLDGNFIKEWDCGVRNMPDEYKNAGGNAKSKKGSLYGFQWRYKTSDKYPKQIGKFENANWQKVIQKDKQGNVIKIWDNVNQALLYTKATGIYNCLYGKSKTAKGFIWEKYV